MPTNHFRPSNSSTKKPLVKTQTPVTALSRNRTKPIHISARAAIVKHTKPQSLRRTRMPHAGRNPIQKNASQSLSAPRTRRFLSLLPAGIQSSRSSAEDTWHSAPFAIASCKATRSTGTTPKLEIAPAALVCPAMVRCCWRSFRLRRSLRHCSCLAVQVHYKHKKYKYRLSSPAAFALHPMART